jgi:NAD-reducing hydrogenase large subunit
MGLGRSPRGGRAVSEIVIEPVTRIEGHAKITLRLDEAGEVDDARFHVTQVRGFERIAEGRPVHEMPSLMARICGICPVSHLVASAKACDEILGVSIPPVATLLRRVMNLAQIVQSHSLNFFHLSSPDLLLGFDSPPARRNILGVAEKAPELARDGIALRRFGQQIIERLGGRRIHPAWVVPGGVSAPLQASQRDAILAEIPEARARAARTLKWYKDNLASWAEESARFGNFPSLYLGLVHETGNAAYSDGSLRVVDSLGKVLVDGADPRRYWEYLGEAVEPWSYLKFPYFLPLGYPEGIYRVGPLARLNIVERLGTPEADAELAEYRGRLGRYPSSSFHYHYARLIEVVHCIDMIEDILSDPGILDTHVRAQAAVNQYEGVGVSEAPRGMLIHHYRVDEDGLVQWVNLVIATGHNNLAMNKAVLEVARHYVKGEQVQEGMLNRVEAVIRAFDPCLSCSTHAMGQMPLVVDIVGADGALARQVTRDA